MPGSARSSRTVTVRKKVVAVLWTAYNSRLMIIVEYTCRESPCDHRLSRKRRNDFTPFLHVTLQESLSLSLFLSRSFSSSLRVTWSSRFFLVRVLQASYGSPVLFFFFFFFTWSSALKTVWFIIGRQTGGPFLSGRVSTRIMDTLKRMKRERFHSS